MRKSTDSRPQPHARIGEELPRAEASVAEEIGDARLVESSREGDDQAFALLVTRYERKLIRVLARLVRDEELARDLAQETFWKVYCRLDRFDTSRRFGPWLFRVGVNLGLDFLRRHEPPPTASLSSFWFGTKTSGHSGDGEGTLDLLDPDPRLHVELAALGGKSGGGLGSGGGRLVGSCRDRGVVGPLRPGRPWRSGISSGAGVT